MSKAQRAWHLALRPLPMALRLGPLLLAPGPWPPAMSASVISVENLGKKYRIKHQAERQRYKALREVLADL